VRADDAPAYVQAFVDDPDLGRLLGVDSDPTEAWMLDSLATAASHRAEGRFLELAVTDASGEPFLGSVNLHHFDPRHRRAELGVWLVPAARGAGVATCALSLVIDWAFPALDLERLEMTTTPDNDALSALAQSLGFVREGVLRKRNFERGEHVDVVWFGLLREEWRARGTSGRHT
jgi:RimJ/RimL family protein N-acetyltransferase